MKKILWSSSGKKLSSIFVLYLIFNILFPKSGIKIDGIPVTVGNLIYILILPVSIIILIGRNYRFDGTGIMLPFSIFYWLGRMLLYHDGVTMGSMFSLAASLCAFPAIYYVFSAFVNSQTKLETVIYYIRCFVILIMIYTIIQYIFGIGTTAIPGLTVNYTDYASNPGGWWRMKHNAYSEESSKMVSTYQNGNLFGANLLLFFPLTYFSIKEKNMRYLSLVMFLVAILLAGSRTMYLTISLFALYLLGKRIQKSRTITRKKMFFLFCTILIVSVMIYNFFVRQSDIDVIKRFLTLFDWNTLSRGTGRIPSVIKYFAWLSRNGGIFNILFGSLGFIYDGGSGEMTYMHIFTLGGLAGLTLTLAPILSTYVKTFNTDDYVMKGINFGLSLYLLAAFFDGGYWLTPTALNLWLLLGMAAQYHNKKINVIRL